MKEYKEDYWEEMERLEGKRATAQHEHDESQAKLWASRDANQVASPGAFDEYSGFAQKFDDTIRALKAFTDKYTPYR